MRLLILISLALIGNTAAGQQKTDHLFWYTGRILKPNVLLTATGDTVIYTPAKGIIRLSPGKKNASGLSARVRTELQQTPKRISEMIKNLGAEVPKPALPLVARQVKAGYEGVRRQYEDAVSNQFSFPDPLLPQSFKPSKGPSFMEEADIDIYKMIMDTIAVMERYMEEHANDALRVPTLPRQNFTYASPCEPDVDANFNHEMERAFLEFAGDDHQFMQKAFSVSRTAALYLDREQEQKAQDACKRFIDFVLVRYNRKLELLWKNNVEDPYRIGALLNILFTVERFNQLIGCSQPFNTEGRMSQVKVQLIKFIEKALNEKDYTIALNMNLLFNFSRTCVLLLGDSGSDAEIVYRALKFNRFKMDIHVSGKIGKDDGFQLAELKANNWFMAVPDSNCRLKWILVEPLVNKMQAQLVATDFRGNGIVIPYTGPKTWNSPIPKMRLDFCQAGAPLQDTIQVYQFDAEGFNETWNIPKMGSIKLLVVNTCIMTTFLDIDKLQEQAEAIKKDPAMIQKMQKEMMAKLQGMQTGNLAQQVKSGDGVDLQSLNAIAKMQDLGREMTEMIYKAAPNKYHLEPQLRNKQTIIVDEKLNGKELFPQNAATIYAWFFLKIEHDPEGN